MYIIGHPPCVIFYYDDGNIKANPMYLIFLYAFISYNKLYDNCIAYLLTSSQKCYSFVSRRSSCSDINFVKVVDPFDAADIDQTEHTDDQGQRIQ